MDLKPTIKTVIFQGFPSDFAAAFVYSQPY